MEDTSTALSRPAPARLRKPKLKLPPPAVRALVDSLPCDTPDRRSSVYAFAEWIIAGARTFTASKRRAGLFGEKRLSKAQAAIELRQAVAKVGGAHG